METKNTATRMNREDRRKQIIDAAMSVFVEKGFKGTTTSEIAATAEVSEVTLFRYFSSKQEIFFEGIRPIMTETLEETIGTSKHLESPEQLKALLIGRILFISRNYEVVKLILNEASLLDDMGKGSFIEMNLHFIRTMLDGMGIAKDRQDAAVRLIMGTILSFLYMPDKDADEISRHVETVTSFILNPCTESHKEEN
ncbi:MAG TPA: helix-turn-helix domain-containing protein [Clostridiaceae bacterium]|nr:helix-turn-helix domain-containing protein [Clostridiaceae bacterium]